MLRSLISRAWTANQTIIDQNSSIYKKFQRLSLHGEPVRVAPSSKASSSISNTVNWYACHSHYNSSTKTLIYCAQERKMFYFPFSKNLELWYSFTLAFRAHHPSHRESFCLFSCVYQNDGGTTDSVASALLLLLKFSCFFWVTIER